MKDRMGFPEQIKSISIKIASEFEGWEFKSNQFKNNNLKHSTMVVDPFWHFKTKSFSPLYGINNSKIEKIYSDKTGKSKTGISSFWQRFKRMDGKQFSIYLLESDRPLEEAENELRKTLKLGIEKINETYDLRSEEDLFKNLPKFWENEFFNEEVVVRYFIAKMILGDTSEAIDYINDKIKTPWPKTQLQDIKKVISYEEC